MRRPWSLALRSSAPPVHATVGPPPPRPAYFRTLIFGLVLSASVSLVASGCAFAKLTASVPPGTDLSKLQSFYVVHHDGDDRGVNAAIRDELSKRGLAATTGSDAERPQRVDVLVTYVDRWFWDITMYLLTLNIQFRHPENNTLLAAGQSHRTSLVRKEPAEMASEILDAIFKQGK